MPKCRPLLWVEAVEPRLLFNSSFLPAVHDDYVSIRATRSTPVAHAPAGFKSRVAALAKARKAAVHLAQPLVAQGSASPFGLTPAQIRGGYGLNSISFGGISGDGAGQTIAIIDQGDYPTALSDLQYFDAYFNLPNPPGFTTVNETGGTALPAQASSSIESSLDVEWAHVAAPGANIILVECTALNDYDLIENGVNWARSQPGVSVISMSFGGPEYSGENAYDQYLTSSHATFIAASGDSGAWPQFYGNAMGVEYPAASPNVLSVGGTRLSLNGTNYGSETGWGNGNQSNQVPTQSNGYVGGGSGGGLSTMYTEPSWQTNVVSASVDTTGMRSVPDISMDADPGTGVPIYDTSDYGPVNGSGGGWFAGSIGGTSLAAPLLSGIIALADQGRALEGLTALNGPAQTLPAIYNLSSSDFNDITTGNNGLAAGVGYDLVTGRGSPVNSLLIPGLVSSYSISGRVFVDTNADGVFDGSDTPLAGYTVYLQKTNGGTTQGSNPAYVTNSSGQFFLSDPNGTVTRYVQIVAPPDNAYLNISTNSLISYGNPNTQTVNFAYFPVAYTGNVNYTLQSDSTGTLDQIAVNGTVTDSVPSSLLSTLSFTATGSGNSLTVDGTNGDPVPAGGISLTGSTSQTLSIIGTATGNDSFTVTSSAISFNANTINFTNVSNVLLNPGAGVDVLNVSSGSITVTPRSTGHGILTRNFSSIAIAAGSSAVFATAMLHTDRMLVLTTSLSIQGKLDLGGNDMIARTGSLPAITTLLTTGYANGSWDGQGLSSAAAHSNTTHLTALGIMPGSSFGSNPFDGVSPLATDILIKYTWYGDGNLDGQVDGSDYSRIDNGLLLQQVGWSNGDFDYNNHIDGSDYTLIDNAFNTQTSML